MKTLTRYKLGCRIGHLIDRPLLTIHWLRSIRATLLVCRQTEQSVTVLSVESYNLVWSFADSAARNRCSTSISSRDLSLSTLCTIMMAWRFVIRVELTTWTPHRQARKLIATLSQTEGSTHRKWQSYRRLTCLQESWSCWGLASTVKWRTHSQDCLLHVPLPLDFEAEFYCFHSTNGLTKQEKDKILGSVRRRKSSYS